MAANDPQAWGDGSLWHTGQNEVTRERQKEESSKETEEKQEKQYYDVLEAKWNCFREERMIKYVSFYL